MKLISLLIENFRAIKRLELNNLGDMVVIAGPNGCGKTQIYHAIRLLKSSYGGYQPNEYQQWWGEFNINLNRPTKAIFRIFADRNRPIRLRAQFDLLPSERKFLHDNAGKLIQPRLWDEVAPGLGNSILQGGISVAQIQRTHGAAVSARAKSETRAVRKALQSQLLDAELTIRPDLTWDAIPNPALELLFSTYQPDSLGVIDYHGAQRTYNREQLGGINLDIATTEDRLRQHALYNWQNKYSNVKSELAAGYVRDLIAKEAGIDTKSSKSLTETLRELFVTFFPGKRFLGPVAGPEGTLDFPVRLESGVEHDIDDLSSGEKEVLFGYLRLRNNAPKHSVVLIDEPELHLNPALIQGLPQFYHRHIGHDLGNQLWLMTHSDALLREAVGQPDFSVYHMQSADACPPTGNQLQPIEAGKALDRAIINLVGDLATYRPGAKVVFFEGGGDADFDVRMTTTLFPHFAKCVNALSMGNRTGVERLHDLLRKAAKSGNLGARFYSIVDRDSGQSDRAADSHQWDRYHIENYLLEPRFILAVLGDLNLAIAGSTSEAAVLQTLKECAVATLNGLVRHELEQTTNALLVSTIKTRVPRDAAQIVPVLREAALSSQQRMSAALDNELSSKQLTTNEKEARRRYARDLRSTAWLATFRGREVLSHFVEVRVKRVRYEVFRDLILAKMRDAGFQPPGMRQVIETILES